MAQARKRRQRRYDHRLRELVRHSGHPDAVAHLGVPRSTALGWLKEDDRHPVITDPMTSRESYDLQAEILTLRARVLFLVSNVLWIAWGWYASAWALVVLQLALAAMNTRGYIKNDPDPA